VTPVSMAVYMAALANGGRVVTPHLLKGVDDGSGWKTVPTPPAWPCAGLRPETTAVIHDGLWMVVNAGGTGGNARVAGRDVSGKTGTAQVISLEGAKRYQGQTKLDLRDNAWFVFFAPRDNPQIAGVVFAEHAEHGSNAALITRHILETFFAKKEGKPMPVFVPPPAPKPPLSPKP
jgi:penicillin-binding protein 2